MVTIMKALSDRNRCRIVAVLQAHVELCACQITELLQVTGATVSRHMGILVQAGLVHSRKEGRWNYFRLNTNLPADIDPLLKWIREGVHQSSQTDHDRQALIEILSLDKEDLCRRQRGAACPPLPGQAIGDKNVLSKASEL
ncbi:MAG: winged helix-turn-helix transcriptional regulator [Desulfobacterales bacterium]|nr:winged helix-turn-helix transcriptional regulator [Desulfobacterales bacterium]